MSSIYKEFGYIHVSPYLMKVYQNSDVYNLGTKFLSGNRFEYNCVQTVII